MGSSPTVPETNQSRGFVDGLRVHFPILRHKKKDGSNISLLTLNVMLGSAKRKKKEKLKAARLESIYRLLEYKKVLKH